MTTNGHGPMGGLDEKKASERAFEDRQKRVSWDEAGTHRAMLSLAWRVLEEAPSAIVVVDVEQGHLLFGNQAARRILGLDQGASNRAATEDISARLHPEDRARLQMQWPALALRSEDKAVEVRVHDGHDYRWLALEVSPLGLRDDGAPEVVIVAMRDVTEQKLHIEALQRTEALLQTFLEHTPAIMYVKDGAGRIVLANRHLEEFVGAGRGELVGKTDEDFFPHAVAKTIRAFDDQIRTAEQALQEEEHVSRNGKPMTYLSIKFPLRGPGIHEGTIGGVSVDVTPIKEAAAATAAMQEELIEAQRATIRELACPLLPITAGAIAMPLVGAIDDARAQRILEVLLNGITAHAARVAILDITGVRAVDTQVADILVRAASAARLLGTQMVLTGIQPAIARTLIELGADLRGMVTKATLRDGIAHALARTPTRCVA
jgi:PAS domain S-box-containing protein